MLVVKIVFWVSLAALVWTHVGYALAAALAARVRRRRVQSSEIEPSVSIVVAAHNESDVIERRVRNLLDLDYPPDLIEVVVASDASTDGTDEAVERLAAADPRVKLVRCERGGKVSAQNRGVGESSGEIVAFSDANALWQQDALRKLVRSFADPAVGYVTGRASYEAPDGTNREGAYWRFELWLRAQESRLGSVTAGNGPIYAVRRSDWVDVQPWCGHDLGLPYLMVQRGRRAVYDPEAVSIEKPSRDIEDEYRRKVRMLRGAWVHVFRGMLRRVGPVYFVELVSHRLLRYASGILHLALLVSSADPRRRGLDLPARARGPAPVAVACGRGEAAPADPRRRACVLLPRRDLGDGGGTGALRPLRPAAALGADRGDAVNRALDVAGASLGLALASPFLAAGALAIKLADGGPVVYRQRRVGKDGREFELFKLRTMVVGAEQQGAGWAVNRGDPRITRAGRLLRRLSLDEVPQLWNVVRGEMSLIGPRPTLAYQVEQYTPRQRKRLDVKPGITGWAQIHGRASLPWEERIELDVWYVENRSPAVDLKILLRTPRALFGGTYKGDTGGWRAGDARKKP